MQDNRPVRLRRLLKLRWCGGSCLLLLYVLAATPSAPAVTMLLGFLDRSHHVAVQQGASGLQVVLRHECFNSSTHRHGMVARALTLMSEQRSAGQPDHVIQFAGSANSEQALALPLVTVTGSLVVPPSGFLTIAAPLITEPMAHPRPPPGACRLLLDLRSTVILV